MTRIHLATGLAVRDRGGERRVLLVASRYSNHAQPIWNLPGGRQQAGELLNETVAREVFEETGLRAFVGELAYVSESFDGDVQFLNATFRIRVVGDVATAPPANAGDHVADVAWISFGELASRVSIGVVRQPLLAYLRGELPDRYAGFRDAGVTVEWPRDSEG